jgi:hypothetical protein
VLSERPWNEIQESRGLLIEALEVNPFLAVAYKDVGDIYLGEYDGRRAWRCWEAARRIAPNHEAVKQVDKLEEMLANEHPDYF